MIPLSDKSKAITPSMTFAIASRAKALATQGIEVYNFGVGEPDFDTPAFIREAAKRALDEGFTRYPPAKGFADLRQVVAEKLKRENSIIADPDSEIFVAVGAMQVIFNTVLHLVEPGDISSTSRATTH